MITLEILKKEKMLAMKAGNRVRSKLLGTLIAEFEDSERRGEVVGAANIYGKISKYIANDQENIRLYREMGSTVMADTLEQGVNELKSLLPLPLTLDEVKEILVREQITNIGAAMKHLSANYSGRYGHLAKDIKGLL